MNKAYALIIIAMLFLVAVSGCVQQGQQPQGGTGGGEAADINASAGLGSDIDQLDEIQSDLDASELDSLASDMDEVAGI